MNIFKALAVQDIEAATKERFADLFRLGLDAADVYRHCVERDIAFLAYAPFAGPRADPLATRIPHVALVYVASGSAMISAMLRIRKP